MNESQYAALLLFLVASIGMCSNWLIVFFIFGTHSLKNSFGRLLSSQILGEAVLSTLFALFVAPTMFFHLSNLIPMSQIIGHLLLICYDICIYCHLAISINRLIAIALPLYLDTIFSPRHVIGIVILCYGLAILPTFYYYVIADCRIYFLLEEWHFTFTETADCAVIVWYADFWKYNVIVVIIVVVDLLALTRVHSFNKAMDQLHRDNRRRNMELNFLKQACFQAVVFVMELITYFILPRFFTDRWIIYLLTTVSWAAVHSADGIITLAYNRDLQKQIYRSCNILRLLSEMSIDVIFSSPLSILTQVETLLATIINAVLLYIIYKYTPQKMKDYRIILMTMAGSQLLIGQTGLGNAAEYMYPLPVLRINGYFKIFGTKYGGSFGVIQLVFLYAIGGLCVTECSLFRYYTLSHKKYHLNIKLYLLFHIAIGIFFVSLGMFISQYFLLDTEGLKEYAKLRGYSLHAINLENDVLAILNIASPYCIPIFCFMCACIISIAIINYVLNFLTHRFMERYFSAVNTSKIHYNQQKKMTILLVGQGSMPLLIPVIIVGILLPSVPRMIDGRSPSKITWELCLCAVLTYPILSPILTVLLMTPYYTPLKQWIRKINTRFKHENSVTVIKF